MTKSKLKEVKEKLMTPPTSRRQATRGKVVKLHKYWKGISTNFSNKEDRRHFLTMMIDATVSQMELSKRRTDKSESKNEAV